MTGYWLYSWRGLSPAGDIQAGHSIGRDKTSVRQLLIRQELQPFRVRTIGYLGTGYWQKPQLASITSQLAALLGAGLPLRESLHLLAEDHPRAGWRCLLRLLGDKIEQGLTFSQAMADFPQVFPPVYCAMMTLGELTGRLDRCCLALADHEERLGRLKQKVLGALRYPAFILLTATAVMALILIWVLPEFARLYAGSNVPLPWPTRCLLAMAQGAADHALPLLILLTTIYACWRRLGYHHGRWRRLIQAGLLYLPGVGTLMRHHATCQLFQTLAMTHPAGVPLDSGLEMAARTLGHPAYGDAVTQLRRHIQQGYALHQAFYRHRLFPPHCHQLIKTGEYSGTLDEVFRQLARIHEQQTRQRADALAQLAEPLLLFIMGGLVCALVMALYLPLLQIGDLFGRL
ncbi:protein transport protein HofC [Acerihabitans arboris]|uniref:Type II secretion system protein F n=1 Tax=Acerihabitans arboris TaxID=2691583 RepID=A0A845SEB4_9GAMM|nr:protein transport protein HofC [Acerihabitans arboris]NDL61274.1 protein transport protein HofC [Acerihabitans arboris]